MAGLPGFGLSDLRRGHVVFKAATTCMILEF